MKRLIFTVTTGRSGTEYLAHLLSFIPGVESHHEASPNFVEVLRAVQQEHQLAKHFWTERKLPAIERSGGRVYAESSHLVCKGFLEPLLELGYRPDLILLSRPHRQVASSFMKLETVPGRTEEALKWYLSPSDPGVLRLPGWESLHDYQLCYWYCLEIQRRQIRYGELIRRMGGTAVEISLQELTTFAGYMRLRKELRLPRFLVGPHDWYRYLKRGRRRANVRSSEKRPIELPSDLSGLEEEVRELVAHGELNRPPAAIRR